MHLILGMKTIKFIFSFLTILALVGCKPGEQTVDLSEDATLYEQPLTSETYELPKEPEFKKRNPICGDMLKCIWRCEILAGGMTLDEILHEIKAIDRKASATGATGAAEKQKIPLLEMLDIYYSCVEADSKTVFENTLSFLPDLRDDAPACGELEHCEVMCFERYPHSIEQDEYDWAQNNCEPTYKAVECKDKYVPYKLAKEKYEYCLSVPYDEVMQSL